MTTPDTIERALHDVARPDQIDLIAKRVVRDQVIGVRMRDVFEIAKEHRNLELEVVRALLRSHWFEVRMVAVSILDGKARAAKPGTPERGALCALYLDEHEHIDVWDLVDRAAPRVVGEHLLATGSMKTLHRLAQSSNRWERRTAIVASFWVIRHGDADDPVAVLKTLADDPEPLVQSALGTAVRELRRHHPDAAAEYEAAHPLSVSARRAARA